MYRIRAILALTLVYLALTANLQLVNVVTGLVIATAVTLLLPRGGDWQMNWRQWPIATFALLRYILLLSWDLLVSGLQVARIVLSPDMPIKPGIIAIPAETKSDLGIALSAHAITLTPGEMVVEVDENGIMYTHCLDASQAEKVLLEAQKQRRDMLEKIFP